MTTLICTEDGLIIELNDTYPLCLLEMDEEKDKTGLNSETTAENCHNDSLYTKRLFTYKKPWTLDFLTPQQMAKAGFYYLGKRDLVRCVHCSIELDKWVRGDDPVTKHKNKSPNCPFFEGYDVSGPNYEPTSVITTPINRNLVNETLRILKTKRIFQELSTIGNLDFVTFEARLNSYEKFQLTIEQSFKSLADAGFFYAGNGIHDSFLCYACSLGLDHWENTDDPWEEHAIWSPNCTHLLLKKGDYYIKKVNKAFYAIKNSPEDKQTTLLPLKNDHRDDSSLDDSIPKSSERKLMEPGKKDENRGKISLFREHLHLYQERDPNTLPDFMLCKICYIQEMNVAVLPCGHVFACVECAIILNSCGICGLSYNTVMKVSVYLNKNKNDDDVVQLPNNSLKELGKHSSLPNDISCCERCHKEEMKAVFIPCGHIYACLECAKQFKECPACSSPICAFIKVYT